MKVPAREPHAVYWSGVVPYGTNLYQYLVGQECSSNRLVHNTQSGDAIIRQRCMHYSKRSDRLGLRAGLHPLHPRFPHNPLLLLGKVIPDWQLSGRASGDFLCYKSRVIGDVAQLNRPRVGPRHTGWLM